jgi:hypothetical protein
MLAKILGAIGDGRARRPFENLARQDSSLANIAGSEGFSAIFSGRLAS